MAKIYMFNKNLTVYQEIDQSHEARYRELGYEKVDKLDLIAVFSPTLNHHKTVHRADVKNWINRGYYAEPTVIYHPEKGEKTVSSEEAKELLKNGWFDSPAKFSKDDTNAIVERAVKNMKKGA